MRKRLLHAFWVIALGAISQQISAQTPGQIYQQATPATNVMDPNGDGYISSDGSAFTVTETPMELGWVAIPQYASEPINDLKAGGSCGTTEIVDNPSTGADASYVMYSDPDGIPDNGDDIMIYRIRISKNSTGAFGFSVLVDTDGCFGRGGGGCPNDPNAVSNNPGFEYEVRYKTGGGSTGVYIDNVDGTTSGTNVSYYAESSNTQRSYALYTDPGCSGAPVFYDFWIPIADLGLTSSSTIRLAAATAQSPSSVLGNSVADIAGVNDKDPIFASDADSAFISLVELQDPTPISNLEEGGCFIDGTSDTPVVSTPVLDSDISVSGTSTEPDGAIILVKMNGDTLGVTNVSSGAWSLSLSRGDLLPSASIIVTARDSCEYESLPSTTALVVNDLDSDNDGILDIDEGNGDDPGGDSDGDREPNYLDTDFPGYVDSNSDGINDIFDTDLDGVPNHFDLDSDNDGITDLAEVGGASYDSDDDGMIDSTTDADNDGVMDVVDADQGGTALTALDSDADGIYNGCDLDSDGDGLLDIKEAGGADANDDGIIDGFADGDGDGLDDTISGSLPANPDSDSDGRADAIDIDSDADGITDNYEVQSSASYIAASGSDTDGDGLDDSYDSDNGGTVLVAVNTDGTDNADYTDTDSDNDGVPDITEGNDNDRDGFADLSATSTDTDQDGLDDAFDNTAVGLGNEAGSSVIMQNTDGDVNPDWRDTDDDGDGTITSSEDGGNGIYTDDFTQGGGIYPDYLYNPDYDGDAVGDNADLDSDNDGAPDTVEDGGTGFDPSGDADADGISNYVDASDVTPGFPIFTDTNSDGINDIYDFDLDGIPDFHDLDSDGDGIVDLIEAGGTDSDGDGLVDSFTDANSDGLDDTLAGSPLTYPDTDADGFINLIDLDSDQDGITDNTEAQISSSITQPINTDTDTDGIDDAYDPDNGGTALSPVNTDAVGLADYMDVDSDQDGVPDLIEGHDADLNGIADWDLNANNVVDGAEGTGDADNDGLLDAFDNVSGRGSGNAIGSNASLQNSDGGGLRNWQDTDDDGDGLATAAEDFNTNGNFADDFTQGGGIFPDYLYNADFDGDGIADNVDLDSDNDGVSDINEDGGTGFDPSGDADADGILNYLDNADATPGFPAFADANSDGINDQYDGDLDGRPNFKDLDSDNDGTQDIVEAGGADADSNGKVDGFTDGNSDGLDDTLAGSPLAEPDSDGDGVKDFYDRDSDNDGIPDIVENGGADADGDGISDSALDVDRDGIMDIFDLDFGGTLLTDLDGDGDGISNKKDRDSDGDGITDILEAGGTDTDGDGMLDGFTDLDGDGLGNAVDPDNGGTSLSDADTDSDGIRNRIDTDSDGDGIVDNIEAQSSAGYIAPSGTDSDNDGIDDNYDPDIGTSILPVDTEGDGKKDFIDSDSDNDGVIDRVEGNDADSNGTVDFALAGTDTDGDGLDDAYDTDCAPCGSVTGVTAPLQDTEADGNLDYRDNDDDDDGILTIDEPLDLNPNNGTKDYLENNIGACGLGYVTTNVSGNADNYTNGGTNNPNLATGVGDDQIAEFGANGDFIILDLTDTIPQSNTLTVRANIYSGAGTTMQVQSSLEGSSFGDLQTFPVSGTTFTSHPYDVNTASGIRYLRIDRVDNKKLGLDAVSYTFDKCDPDKDLDGIIDAVDEDDDNDGIPDLTENNGVDPAADADSDGTPNYLDTDYAGFTDSNGDGVNDIFDFDLDGVPNSYDLDSDSDGITDAVEGNAAILATDMTSEGLYPVFYVQLNDSDADGLTDPRDPDSGGSAYPLPDTDSDGSKDYLDIDSDGDGQLDLIEGFDDDNNSNALNDYIARAAVWETANGNPGYYTTADTDLDGVPNWLEDADSDGILNYLDSDLIGTFFRDSDQDGLVDLLDPDVFGVASSVPDIDTNGIPDYMDPGTLTLLPVVWIVFEGSQDDQKISIHWATAAEKNSDYFQLESSVDGKRFKSIAMLKAAGTSHSRLDYFVDDHHPNPGLNYYRIKQMDVDGAFEYSKLISVAFKFDFDSEFAVYPNPLRNGDYLKIKSKIKESERSTILIYNMQGKIVQNPSNIKYRNQSSKGILIQDLKPGMYLFRFLIGTNTYNKRILVID